MVKALLAAGLSPLERNAQGNTPLVEAKLGGDREVVDMVQARWEGWEGELPLSLIDACTRLCAWAHDDMRCVGTHTLACGPAYTHAED